MGNVSVHEAVYFIVLLLCNGSMSFINVIYHVYIGQKVQCLCDSVMTCRGSLLYAEAVGARPERLLP